MNKFIKFKDIYALVLIIFPIILILSLPFLHQEKIKIIETNPNSIVAGKKFNEYSGLSTISITGEGFKEGDIIFINNKEQVTSYGNSGWMTCTVNKEFYEKTGKLKIFIARKDNNRTILKSNLKIIKILKE